jgi:Domain of Unknown Function (DUF349)
VDLLERRARLPEVTPEESAATLARLREALVAPAAVGDLDGLRSRLESVAAIVDGRRAEAQAMREEAKVAARATRERIVADAEALAESTHWKVAGDRLRALLDEWKSAPHVDRPTEQALWKRFGAARNTFDRRRRQHFAQVGAQRVAAKAAKQEIISEAVELSTSTDWGPTAARMRTLMERWRAAGQVGRADEDELWRQFRAAQDAFFSARSAVFTERDADQNARLTGKEAVLAEAEALVPVTDVASAKAALRGIHERWEAIGTVPKPERERLEARMRRVEDAVRAADQSQWQRFNPEGRARAQAAVDQLRAAIARLEQERASALAAGDDRGASAAEESLAARKAWLEGAETALAEFSGGR